MYSTRCYVGMMDMELFDRLQIARRKAGFADATSAARAFGWNENTYRSHENGTRGLTRPVAMKYAKAFKVSAAWLLTNETSMIRKNVFPVLGYVGQGDTVEYWERASMPPLEEIEIPYGFSVENCAALIARGNSQSPRVKNGEVLIYCRDNRKPEDLQGREAIVQVRDGSLLLKTIRKGSREGLFDLESHNADLIEDIQIDWAWELLSIVPRGVWQKIR
jgi:phage repressor protein C with HTH and peptisase S24 domain